MSDEKPPWQFGSRDFSVPSHLDVGDVIAMLRNDHFSNVIMKCWRIYNRKGNDYTRGKGDLDRGDNFRQAAENVAITPYQAWGVYFYKHVAAVWRFLKDGKVESEPIEERIYDIINYAILFLLLVEEARSKDSK
jgi:hypothetical protein